jgi:TatD DNase family protein
MKLPSLDMHCHTIQAAEPAEGDPVMLSVTFMPDEFATRPSDESASNVVWGVGLHPWAFGSDEELAAFMRHLPESVAIGEIGLDGTDRARSPMDFQRAGLKEILSNPETKRRIVSIHGWMAYQEVVDALEENPVPGLVYHWFMGMGPTLEQAVALDIYFSVNDAMFSLKEGHEVVASVPRNRVLMETDSPYIQLETGAAMNPGDDVPGPPPLRPGQLELTEGHLAQAWGDTVDGVRRQLWENLAELEARVEIKPFAAASRLNGERHRG